MADKSEWKTPSMEGEGKGGKHQYGRKPRTPVTRANPNSWETHLVRKRWDIGPLRALRPGLMMMMMRFNIPPHKIPPVYRTPRIFSLLRSGVKILGAM